MKKKSKGSNKLVILKKHFPECFDNDNNFNLRKFLKEIDMDENQSLKENYSLEWIGKSYARILAHKPPQTILKEDKDWNNKPENKNSGNILIKGDNLEALKHLVNEYCGKIKLIYIDPPYNTKNSNFVYNDNRKFTIEELSKIANINEKQAKKALKSNKIKAISHSAWLTFIYPRLCIARRLLRDDGIIFVSIDDNEVAQLRLLMDEIFGEENFVAGLVHQKKLGGGQAKYYYKWHDYILVYAKNKFNIPGLYKRDDRKLKIIQLEDGKLYWYDTDVVRRTHGKYNPQEGPKNVFYEDLDPKRKKKYEEALQRREYILIKDKKTDKHFVAKYGLLGDKKKLLGSILRSGDGYSILTRDGKNRIEDLFDFSEVFDNPKPVDLIKIFLLNTNKQDIILDFFAGSGTTGDAVMQLNAEDGGNRKFILIQLDEPIDSKKNKTVYDFVKNELGEEIPTIFNICKERLIRSATKIIIDKQKEIQEVVVKIKKIENKKKSTKKDQEKLMVLKEKYQKLNAQLENIEKQDFGFKIFELIPI